MSGRDDGLALPSTARVTSDMAAAAVRYLTRTSNDDLLPVLGLAAGDTYTDNGRTYCAGCGCIIRNARGVCGKARCQDAP